MLTLGGGAKIFVCDAPTDLRKGFVDGLSNLVESNQKVLYFDVDSLVIWYKKALYWLCTRQKKLDEKNSLKRATYLFYNQIRRYHEASQRATIDSITFFRLEQG